VKIYVIKCEVNVLAVIATGLFNSLPVTQQTVSMYGKDTGAIIRNTPHLSQVSIPSEEDHKIGRREQS